MRTFALYDLDRTVLRHATFTPFLLFAAWRGTKWRVVLAPLWLGAMIGHKAGFRPRGALKQFGLRLFLGPQVTEPALAKLGEAFAEKVVPAWVAPGAQRAIEADQRAGHELVLVTAAMHFYALPLGRRLGFSRVLATQHGPLDGSGACRLDGANCYGPEKVKRVAGMLAATGIARDQCRVVFYSDSLSDAPLFDYADEAVLVDAAPSDRRHAGRAGWRVASFKR